MGNRQIFSRSRQSSSQLADLVGSIFALELLSPSREVYLISPWITDLAVIRNGQAELRALLPDRATGDVWLSTVLMRLAERGTDVRVVCRPGQASTEEFLRKLPSSVETRRHDPLHAKGLITDHAFLSGSMNFTYSGLHLNDETVDLKTSTEDVAKAQLEAASYWNSIPT